MVKGNSENDMARFGEMSAYTLARARHLHRAPWWCPKSEENPDLILVVSGIKLITPYHLEKKNGW